MHCIVCTSVFPYSECSPCVSFTACSPASEVTIELDVIQDSIPQGKKGKASKQVRYTYIRMHLQYGMIKHVLPCYSVMLSPSLALLFHTFS